MTSKTPWTPSAVSRVCLFENRLSQSWPFHTLIFSGKRLYPSTPFSLRSLQREHDDRALFTPHCEHLWWVRRHHFKPAVVFSAVPLISWCPTPHPFHIFKYDHLYYVNNQKNIFWNCFFYVWQSAVGHDYQSKLSKHCSQTDTSKGFGGKFGVQADRVDEVFPVTVHLTNTALITVTSFLFSWCVKLSFSFFFYLRVRIGICQLINTV